ncbi:hypothetical protein O181_121480, partial [Austropuccinia psidii MF-1]|nr:hypothetical protein [Austropuccinia psidii MF-1]
ILTAILRLRGGAAFLSSSLLHRAGRDSEGPPGRPSHRPPAALAGLRRRWAALWLWLPAVCLAKRQQGETRFNSPNGQHQILKATQVGSESKSCAPYSPGQHEKTYLFSKLIC